MRRSLRQIHRVTDGTVRADDRLAGRRENGAMSEPRAERPAMSDYGVPADLDGVLPWSWAEERLARSRNYWLVTASADRRPHAMPVWGVWSSERRVFWTSCSPNARKARNLAANPRCTVAPEDTGECVSLEGTAAPVTDPATVDAAITAYYAKYGDELGMPVDEYDGFMRTNALFEVTPERAFGIVETPEDFAARATRWVF